MNKTAIKNYAIWARVQLIESAKQRAYEYEITENGENNPNLETVGGRLLGEELAVAEVAADGGEQGKGDGDGEDDGATKAMDGEEEAGVGEDEGHRELVEGRPVGVGGELAMESRTAQAGDGDAGESGDGGGREEGNEQMEANHHGTCRELLDKGGNQMA